MITDIHLNKCKLFIIYFRYTINVKCGSSAAVSQKVEKGHLNFNVLGTTVESHETHKTTLAFKRQTPV